MKSFILSLILLGTVIVVPAPASTAEAGHPSPVSVCLKSPGGRLRMGDVPVFIGKVTNTGNQPVSGLVVYLSLVSLASGREHPVDLEDWSARKAIHIDHLGPGESSRQEWSMRLIESGPFGAALTVVDPARNQPQISPLAFFDINPKPTVVSSRILPVALGEPILLLGISGVMYRRRRRHS